MNVDTLVSYYPNILSNMVDNVENLNALLVINDNNVLFDKNNYTYRVDVTDAVVEIVGKKGMGDVAKKLSCIEAFDKFDNLAINLYGVRTLLDKDSVAKIILDVMETQIS